MSKKTDDFYYGNFIESAAVACEAAYMLKEIVADYDAEKLAMHKTKIHEIEHKGDHIKHDLMYELARAFITPIERNDIMKLSQNIDDVTDSIEDIVIHMYINNVTEVWRDSIEFADIIIKCCTTMKEMLEEFRNFKKSKRLKELIIEINRLEEVGDEMYIENMRRLHKEVQNPMVVIAWREIYDFYEKCCDACEHVADIVEDIIIGNT